MCMKVQDCLMHLCKTLNFTRTYENNSTHTHTHTHTHTYIYIYIYIYISPNIVRGIKSRRLKWAGHVARMEESRSAFKILTGKPIGKRPLGRPRRRWGDNIRFEEIGINVEN